MYWGQGLMEGGMKQLYGIMIDVCVSQVYVFAKTQQMVHLRFMHFIVFKFYILKDQ